MLRICISYKNIKEGLIITIKNLSLSEVMDLENKDYEFLVFQGCGGDLEEWVHGITNMLKDNNIVPEDFAFDEIYSFDNGNLTNMLFALNNSKISFEKLAIYRLKIRESFGAMWLSDYIDCGYIKNIEL